MSTTTPINYSLRESTLASVIDQAILDTAGHIKNRNHLVRAIRDAIVEAELDGQYLAARKKADMADTDALIRYLEFNSAELEKVKKRYRDDLSDFRATIDALREENKELKEKP